MKEHCQDADPACPVHPGISHCPDDARVVMYRIDMEDRTGTPVCGACANDMQESGLFRLGRLR